MCAGGSSCAAGAKPISSAQTQVVNDEQQESAGASENVISANLVEQQAPEQAEPQPQQQQEQPQQQQEQPQQNDVHEEYLPPKH